MFKSEKYFIPALLSALAVSGTIFAGAWVFNSDEDEGQIQLTSVEEAEVTLVCNHAANTFNMFNEPRSTRIRVGEEPDLQKYTQSGFSPSLTERMVIYALDESRVQRPSWKKEDTRTSGFTRVYYPKRDAQAHEEAEFYKRCKDEAKKMVIEMRTTEVVETTEDAS